MRNLLLIALVLGCGYEPPATVTVGQDLPEGIRMAAEVARQVWCEAPVGWCPEFVTGGGEGSIVVGHFGGEQLNDDPGPRARNDGGHIRVSPYIVDYPVEWLAGTMTHEFGHFGIDGHIKRSPLMKMQFESAEDIPLFADALAVKAWCDQQGCP